jgi:exopolysaccharide production protein ExoQ
MPPFLALLLWFIILLCLLSFDPAKDRRVSPALWVPFVWLALLGSRSPSQWLSLTTATGTTTLEEGNPIDHIVYLALTFLALRVLVARRLSWRDVFARNSALLLFALFALLSITWSDFPFASFRRWLRELATYLMVLVVLSDTRPLQAIEALIRRLSYLLIPLSVVVIKYFREISVGYDGWSGRAFFVGVSSSKNGLGALCLVSGLFFFWDTLRRWPDRRSKRTQRILVVNAAFIGMTLWLLNLADSATSRLCLVIGCLIITVVQSAPGRANPNRFKRLIPTVLIAGLIVQLIFTTSDTLATFLGRDPTLTGRTEIWKALLNMDTNPLFGVGYQSFWLGGRVPAIWAALGMPGLNEAHNGYLEMYLNLGLLGLCLLVGLLIASYRMLCRRLTVSLHFASISLAVWTILVVYNMTERAFELSLPWFTFLLVGIAVPRSDPEMPADAQSYRQSDKSPMIARRRAI